MQTLIIIAIVTFLIVVVLAAIKNKAGEVGSLPYEKKKALFTPAERSFYGVLKQVVAEDFEVFGQVRMADFLGINKGLEKGTRQGFFNKIKAKHVDFVLCNPDDLSVVAVIELDDKSHNRAKAIESDKFKDAAFKVAGIPLIRFKAQKSYARNDVIKVLQQSIDFNGDALPNHSKIKEVATLPMKKVTQIKSMPKQTDDKLCPKCSSTMVQKKPSSGKYAGKVFLACSAYPKCKTILPVEVAG